LLYYPGGIVEPDNCAAAICTAIEQAGVVTLIAFMPQRNPTHHALVTYAGSLTQGQKKSQNVVKYGVFELTRKPTEAHKMPWRLHCEQQIELMKSQLESYRQQKAETEAQRLQSGASPYF
jgi:hypothetical protein